MTSLTETSIHRELGDVERWFIKRGLPHFIEDYRATDDVFNRALPLFVVLVMLQMGAELASKAVTWQHRLIGAGAGLGAVLVLFLIANLVRQPKRWYRWPRKVGVLEMSLLIALDPAVGYAVRGQPAKVAVDFAVDIAVLVVIYAATAYAVLPVVLWALRHSIEEISNLVNLASKALPMLALFGTFIFLNADMWHIAALISRHKLWETVGFFAGITFLFLLVRLPEEVQRLQGGYTRESVAVAAKNTPLVRHLDHLNSISGELPQLATSRRQRVNMLFVMGFTQIIQVLLLSVVVFVYFVSLGKLCVSDEQISDWLKLADPNSEGYIRHISGPGTLFGFQAKVGDVVFSDALLQTAILITTFSAFFFAVSAVTDDAYRKDFFESITGKITKALDVRCGYITIYLDATKRAEFLRRPGYSHDPIAEAEEHRRTRQIPILTHGNPDGPVFPPANAFPPGQEQVPVRFPQQPYQPRPQPYFDAQPQHGQPPLPPRNDDTFHRWPQQ